MAKYLVQASYSPEGTRGLRKDGGSKRRAALQETASSLGGTLEAFYYAFGDTDVVAILNLSDNASAAAAALTISASGSVSHYKTTVLLTPEEIDQAAKTSVAYKPPGQ
ncbi:MAG: GYD domain-containing protein [Armatimonadota bacterium]|nr:GYD domain-containing protein [Armatimonadota bacterium]MDR7548389.1 GYD domain-containing protein [Armatimonadota bacterium]